MTAADPFGARLPRIESSRLCLRHPRATDASQVLSIFGDQEAMRYWSHEPLQDLAAAHNYIKSIDEGFEERSLFQWAIAEVDSDLFIGTVTIFEWSRTHRRAELGYMLAPSHWKRGLASEAVYAALDWAFTLLQLHRVEADIDPRNQSSAKLLERLGFVLEGRLKDRWFTYGEWSDSHIYGLVRDMFRASTH